MVLSLKKYESFLGLKRQLIPLLDYHREFESLKADPRRHSNYVGLSINSS